MLAFLVRVIFLTLSGFISELLKSLHQKQEDLSESEPFNFGLIFFLKVSIVTIFLLLFSPQLSLVFFLLSASQYWWPKRVKHASQCNKRKTKKAAIKLTSLKCKTNEHQTRIQNGAIGMHHH